MGREMADATALQMVAAGGNAWLQDAGLNVEFYMEALPDQAATLEKGSPQFKEVVMISIAVPGQLDVVKRPAWDADYRRFPKLWKAFQEGQTTPEAGTPLSVWPQVTVVQVKELNYRGIRTVEQLAAVSDVDCTGMGMFSLRQRARDFVEAAKGNAPLVQIRAENEALNLEVAALKAQMAEVIAAQIKAANRAEEKPATKK